MGIAKNKKKYWRKCLPEVNDEIIKLNQLKEIEDASFSIDSKSKPAKPKCSTVPRVIPKKPNLFHKTEIVDVWTENYSTPELSKRRQKMIANKSKPEKREDIIHPGMSWNPEKKEHENLLNMIAQDEIQKNIEKKKYEFKIPENIANDNNDIEIVEEEIIDDSNVVKPIKKTKFLTSTEKKRKLLKMKLLTKLQKKKSKEKYEAHCLRNIPKLCKEIKDTTKLQKEKLEYKKSLEEKKKAEKIVKEQLKSIPFQLPTELAPNLRSVVFDRNLLRDLCDRRLQTRQLKTDKPKKMKKLRKMIKKKGLN